MLVDIKLKAVDDPTIKAILAVISGDEDPMPQRIGEGMYLVNHWNMNYLTDVRQHWRESPVTYPDYQEYGVCDTPEQAVEKLGLRDRPERLFVAFVRIRKDEQPPSGGWRWHKWGEYIGEKSPQCEYIHHEPEIEEVYTFQVYEPIETT